MNAPANIKLTTRADLIEFVKALARADANRDYDAALARQRSGDSENHAHPDLRPL